MAQSRILIDTNSYLRIASVIHPLLRQEFGVEKYCIYSLPDLEKEMTNNLELQSKFKWFMESKFKENRKNILFLSKKQLQEIEDRIAFLIHATKNLNLFNVSLTDIRCIAYGWILDVPVVTEDKDMTKLANEFEIKIIKTLDLIKLMYQAKYISKQKLLELKKYLKSINEYPKSYDVFFNSIQ